MFKNPGHLFTLSIKTLLLMFCMCFGFVSLIYGQKNLEYDLVIQGGRVIDPETGLDAQKNIGIIGNRIESITSEKLKGKKTVDATGLVVSPGFIDLHVHGITNKEQEYQVHDGVTTALELEWGIPFLKDWYATRLSKALINYGASVNWSFQRFKTFDGNEFTQKRIKESVLNGAINFETMQNYMASNFDEPISETQLDQTLKNIKKELSQGGIGIGIPVGYLPGADEREIFRIYQYAGKNNILIYTHVRSGGIKSVQQVLSDALLTNAPLHIVHINSMALENIDLAIEMVQVAQSKNFNITTELYPYTAASTTIQSAMFNDGWQEKLGISYRDLKWVTTGERLTRETFNKNRKNGGMIIIYMMKPEWIKSGIEADGVMIASDGMPEANYAHPRTAGTFSRVLGKYVREEKVLDLASALKKMTLLPAKRLENAAPMMKNKGRIQVGADADITIFNPETILDTATFENGLSFSKGIHYVIVNGVIVVKNGKTIEDTFPGQPIYGKYKK